MLLVLITIPQSDCYPIEVALLRALWTRLSQEVVFATETEAQATRDVVPLTGPVMPGRSPCACSNCFDRTLRDARVAQPWQGLLRQGAMP